MQHAGTTLKRIFATLLRRQAGDDAPMLAWPLACGGSVAEKTTATVYANGVLTVEVPDAAWQQQLQGLQPQYIAALRPISAQPVDAITFVIKRRPERASR